LDETLPPEEAVRRIDAAWSDWLAVLDRLEDESMAQPGASGDWSPADLPFHMAIRDDQVGFDIQFRHDNNGDAPPERDSQRMNEQVHLAHAGPGAKEAGELIRDTHEAMLLLVGGHQDDDLSWLVPEIADHYRKHADQLRIWRSR
jgi:hypothetical protein